MKSFSSTLKVSVSILALTAGAGFAGTAEAVTLTGNQTGYVSSGDITDGLTIAAGAIVSPDGVTINFSDTVIGSLVNDGTVQIVVDDDPANTFLFAAVKASGALTGNLTNTGSVEAEEAAQTAVIDDVDTAGDIMLETPMFAAATTAGIFAGSVDGNFANTGDVGAHSMSGNTYDAVVAVTGDALVGAGSRSFANASGVQVISFDGDISNGADSEISASAEATTEAAMDVSAANARTEFGELNSSSNATGMQFPTAGDILNDGVVSVSASSMVAADANVSATGGTAAVDWGSIYLPAGATGIFVEGSIESLTNSGEINATAQSVLNLNVEVSGPTALVGQTTTNSGNAVASSYGVLAGLTGDVINSGKIGATATSHATTSVTATASDGPALADFDGDEVLVLSGGIFINGDSASTDFDNKGSINALASAGSIRAVTISAPDGFAAYNNPASSLQASSTAVSAGSLHGFSNAGDISAESATDGNYQLAVSGSDLAEVITTGGNGVTAVGVNVTNSLASEFVNSADIVASGKAHQSVEITATATDGPARVRESYNVSSLAVGVVGREFDGGLTNSKNILADSSMAITIDVTADSGTDSSVNMSNVLGTAAYGINFALTPGGAVGDISNTGTIKASASSDIAINASAIAEGDSGAVFMHNEISLIAEGLLEGASNPDIGTAHGFANSGTVSANGSLTLSITEGSDQFSSVRIGVLGAFLSGPLNEISNTGNIEAVARLDMQDAPDLTATGFVVGLWASTPGAETAISNTGKITASLDGTGSSTALVAGINAGFFVNLGSKEPGPDDAFSITNAGTIAASNTFGQSYGIYAGQTPLPVVINQQGGSISGGVAIEIANNKADELNWTGGEIHGVVEADEFDVVNVFAGTGTPANKTITAGTDFTLSGGAELNVGVKDAPVTFALAGNVTGTATVNVNDDANLLLRPTGKMDVGTLVMDPEATLTFEFDHDSAGLITTTGDAAIDGKLVAVVLPDLYGDKGSHTVVEAGGLVTGAFDNVSIVGDTLLLDFSAAVGEQDVTISWKRTPFNEVAGLTINSTSVATALEDGYDPTRPPSKNDPELNDILSAMFTLADPVKYDRVLNSWSGSEHAQLMRAAANLSEPYLMSVGEHLNDIRHTGSSDAQSVMLRPKGSSNAIAPLSAAGASGGDDGGFAFWGRAFGRWADTRGDVEADGYDEDTFGAVLGADFRVSPNVLLGIVGGYTDDSIDFDDGDEGKIKRWTIGGYVSATFGAFYVDASVNYAGDNYKMRRTIVYGDTSCLAFNCTETATARYDGDGWLGHAELGYDFDLGGASLRPFAGLNYASVSLDPFSEAGGGDLGLDVLAGKGKSLQSRLGARLSGEWGSGGSTVWVPELRAEWRHEFKDDPAFIAANLTGLPNDPFVAIGSRVTGDLAVVGAGVTALMGNGVGVFFDYQGAFGSGYSSHIIQGGVRVRF